MEARKKNLQNLWRGTSEAEAMTRTTTSALTRATTAAMDLDLDPHLDLGDELGDGPGAWIQALRSGGA